MPTFCLLVPAAGSGRRFAASAKGDLKDDNKLEAELGDRPVFLRALECFNHRKDVSQTVLAVDPDQIEQFKFKHGARLGFHGVTVVPGGRAERWETVLNALEAVDDDCTHVAVHDAARPIASAALIDRVFGAAEQHAAIVPGLPVTNTLKRVAPASSPGDDGSEGRDPVDAILGSAGRTVIETRLVMETIDRTNLVEVQTPQVFETALLRRAYEALAAGELDPSGVTDDASLVEALGQPVHVVDGDVMNLKITRHEDLEMAKALISATKEQKAAETARKRLFADDED